MRRVVVDTSLMLRLVGVHGDAEQIAEVVSDLSRQAPELLLIECAHVLGKMVRRRALSPAKATSHIKIIHAMVDIHTTVDDPVGYLAIANRLQHSAYDVRFLVLAQRLALPLLTLDEVFAEKVRRARIDVQVETMADLLGS